MSDRTDDIQKVQAFLKTQKLTVISTCGLSREPEGALVAFAEDPDLCIYFQTGVHTRKAANLQVIKSVAFTFGLTLEDGVTVQYQGRATRLIHQNELEACKQLFVAKDSPTTEEYFNHPTAIFFKVHPLWIGYSDYTQTPPKVAEVFYL